MVVRTRCPLEEVEIKDGARLASGTEEIEFAIMKTEYVAASFIREETLAPSPQLNVRLRPPPDSLGRLLMLKLQEKTRIY